MLENITLITIINAAREKKEDTPLDKALVEIKRLLRRNRTEDAQKVRGIIGDNFYLHPVTPKIRKLIAILDDDEINNLFIILNVNDTQKVFDAMDKDNAWKVYDALGPKKVRGYLGNADNVPSFLDRLGFPRAIQFLKSLELDDLKRIIELLVHDPILDIILEDLGE